MARLKADVLSFETPARSTEKSRHGSQGEDSVIELYLPGWGRECSEAAKSALLPSVPPVSEGNGRGRGTTFIDAYRRNVSRSCGGDFLSLKAPFVRKDGTYSTAPDLFKGSRDTLEGLILNLRENRKNGKKVPLVICHASGDVFSPVIHEWAIFDVPTLVSGAVLMDGWDNVHGIPVRPTDAKSVGRGGSPVPVWIRTQVDSKNPMITHWILTASASGKRVNWKSGSMSDFAAQVDAACR